MVGWKGLYWCLKGFGIRFVEYLQILILEKGFGRFLRSSGRFGEMRTIGGIRSKVLVGSCMVLERRSLKVLERFWRQINDDWFAAVLGFCRGLGGSFEGSWRGSSGICRL